MYIYICLYVYNASNEIHRSTSAFNGVQFCCSLTNDAHLCVIVCHIQKRGTCGSAIQICIHTNIYIYIHPYIYICVSMHTHIYMYTYVCIYMYTLMYTHLYIYRYIHM